MTPKLRLLKVIVQPVFVLDDGDTITEQTGQVVTVAAKDWPKFAGSAFGPDEMATMQAQIDNP